MVDNLPKIDLIRQAGVEGQTSKVVRTGGGLSFHDVLARTLETSTGLKFSAHASERLQLRGIELSADDKIRLSGAVDNAEKKGAVDSLIIVDDMAFIVSIKNRTVITALTGDDMKNNVFTNIDSTILA